MTNRKILYSAGLIIILAGVGFLIYNSRNANISSGPNPDLSPSPSPIGNPSPIINPSHGPIAIPPPIPGPKPLPRVTGGCFPGGCSGQLCSDQRLLKDSLTTCEFRPEFACYKITKCERQSSGECGWTPTPEFTACLNNPSNSNLR